MKLQYELYGDRTQKNNRKIIKEILKRATRVQITYNVWRIKRDNNRREYEYVIHTFLHIERTKKPIIEFCKREKVGDDDVKD